jgi:dienelactone hydrolase
MRFLALLITLFSILPMTHAQQKITFLSSDGIPITADLYLQDKGNPYIILFHQANYSRGEYSETAPRLMKLGYNCLAVDLRSGKEVNYVQNETAAAAKNKNLGTGYLDAEKDMLAAIEYVKNITKERIILFGSSYSASLTLKVAKNNPSILAVIAFSPGEYFGTLKIKDAITHLDKPLFIGATTSEQPFIREMISGMNANFVSWFIPSKSKGIHGSRALWPESPENEDCWMALLQFFKKLRQ